MAKTRRYGVCVNNRGNAAGLELRKIYQIVEDAVAKARGLVRVIDESGESYLYPERYFIPIEVPRAVVSAFSKRSARRAAAADAPQPPRR
jgi:hypothetical protein